MKDDWKSIETNLERVYILPSGREYKIKSPKLLKIRDSGAHMVVDKEFKTHYIPKYEAIIWLDIDSDKGTFHRF